MPKRTHQDYHSRATAEVAQFVDSLKSAAINGGTFDSAAADEFISTAVNQSSVAVPTQLQAVFDEAGTGDTSRITRAILDGAAAYETQHGTDAPADVLQQAIHLAYSTTDAARRKFALDSASNSLASDPLSLQPNRAIVAILSAMGDAIPFAHYLPADISSNEAVLAIMSHNAGSTFGSYAQGGLMDGHLSGDPYITSSRVHTSNPSATGVVAGALTAVQESSDVCKADAAPLKLLRGRALVYVDGRVAGKEVDSTGTGFSPISGSIKISGNSYQIAGHINPDSGAYELTTTPALPETVPVVVEGFIDYERSPEITPSIITQVNTFKLHAKPWRVITQQSIDSRTQMSNELGLDPYSESVIAIQAQFANERHYDVLAKARRLAANNKATFDFKWSTQGSNKSRDKIWVDFASVLGAVSQQMAIDTMNHGVTHLYVGKHVAAQFMSLPREIFEPSGVAERPNIFRIGRLFGRFEVYYTPKGVSDSPIAAQILCIGRATDVTRNPFVLGDAVPPTVIPLAVNADLRQGAGFYARNFTAVNPHGPSSLGAAMIDVINMN
jgi:hypothetical protein